MKWFCGDSTSRGKSILSLLHAMNYTLLLFRIQISNLPVHDDHDDDNDDFINTSYFQALGFAPNLTLTVSASTIGRYTCIARVPGYPEIRYLDDEADDDCDDNDHDDDDNGGDSDQR